MPFFCILPQELFFKFYLQEGLELVDEPELGEEEEYDALNDETFGTDAFRKYLLLTYYITDIYFNKCKTYVEID